MSLQQTLRLRVTAQADSCSDNDSISSTGTPTGASVPSLSWNKEEVTGGEEKYTNTKANDNDDDDNKKKKRMAKPTISTKNVFYPPSEKYWRIGNQWYDLSCFNHPGGKQILEIARDRFDDATFAFEAHHHNYQKAKKVLNKYLVKDQAQAQREALKRPSRDDKGFPQNTHHDAYLDADKHPNFLEDDTFYSVLRVKVSKYLKEVGCPDGEPTWACIIFFWTIFATWCLGMVITYYTGSYIASFFTGIVATWLASFGHNWVHQPKYKHWGWSILSMDVSGLDSEIWFRDHVLHHHMFTNTPWDHHITALEPYLSQDQTVHRNWWQVHAVPYILHILFALGTYATFITHFIFLLMGQEVISVSVVIAKLIWPIQHYIFYQRWGWHGIGLLVLMSCVTGNYFYTIAFMNHNAEHCTDLKKRNASKDWGEAQLRSCADFCVHWNFYQSMLFILLNFHTVHHLFPKVDFCHHPAISDIMIETAKEFDIPYRCGDPITIYKEMLECYRQPHSLYTEILVYAGGNI